MTFDVPVRVGVQSGAIERRMLDVECSVNVLDPCIVRWRDLVDKRLRDGVVHQSTFAQDGEVLGKVLLTSTGQIMLCRIVAS